MSVTIRDVARQAGVSISTVSRVLNGSSPVREEKCRVVLETVEALGYVPNPAARSLLGKRVGAIGALLPFVNGEFFSELLSGLDEAARSRGLILAVSTSHRQPSEFRRAVQTLDKRVDGFIVMAPDLDAEGAASLVTSDPVVFINTYAEGLNADVFNFDNAGGVRALTEHLVQFGHRKIGLATGPPTAGDARERVRGYRMAMADAGLEPTVAPSGFTREAGATAARALLGADEPPTAIVAPNDAAALGMISALQEDGVRVPDDVSVVGFDGTPVGANSAPSLTTVRVPIREIGVQAVERLASRIDGSTDGPPETVLTAVDVVARESSGPVALSQN